MGASRRVTRSAMVILMAAAAGAAPVPASAQQYESSLRSVGYFPDPLARNPRLLGMGRLSLASDVHNDLNIWDVAGNPLGIAGAESISVVEVRPRVRTAAGVHDLPDAPRERQDLGARHMRNGLEAWRRSSGGATYGLVGEFATLKLDRPYSQDSEMRSRFTVPAISGVVNGPLVWIPGNRVQYALRVGYTLELLDQERYDFFRLANGDYLGRRTSRLSDPDLFTPNHSEVSSLGLGGGLSYRFGEWLTAAANYDHVTAKVRGRNIGLRSESRLIEDRPFGIGQLSLAGRWGALRWVADGRGWRARSEEFWEWSVSAGPTSLPLSGSGKRLDRDEEGTTLRTRARWTGGALDLDAGFNTSYRRTIVTPWYPPEVGGVPGFNDFLDEIGTRPGADTLNLPQRVMPSQVEARGVEMSAGATWRLAGDAGLIGLEVTRRTERFDQPAFGGPEPSAWDVRAGTEIRLAASLLGRAGFVWGQDDRDDLSAADEYQRRSATAGLGYRPTGSRWSADLAYAFDWLDPDFGDPLRQRRSGQEFVLQVRWPF